MIKKTITYTNFNDVEVTEDFYFNLNKYEIINLQFTEDGGNFEELVTKIINEKDNQKILAMFQELIMKSYGEKTPDGKRFIKKDPVDGHLLAEDFVQSAAYDQFFLDFLKDDYASKFVTGLVPADMAQEIEKIKANNADTPVVAPLITPAA
jgi:hypothetical protein